MKLTEDEKNLLAASDAFLGMSLIVLFFFELYGSMGIIITGQLLSMVGTTTFIIYKCKINLRKKTSDEQAKDHTKRRCSKLKRGLKSWGYIGALFTTVVVPWTIPVPVSVKLLFCWFTFPVATFILTWIVSFRLSKLLYNNAEWKFLEIAFLRQYSMLITLHYALLILSFGILLIFCTVIIVHIFNFNTNGISILMNSVVLAWLCDIVCMVILAAISLIGFMYRNNMHRKSIQKTNEQFVETEQMEMSLLKTSTHNIDTKKTCSDHIIHFDPDVSYQRGNLAISQMKKTDSFTPKRDSISNFESLSVVELQADTNRLRTSFPDYFVSLELGGLPLNSQQTPPQSKDDSISITSTPCRYLRNPSSHSFSVSNLWSVCNRISTSIPNLSVLQVLSRLPVNSQQASLTLSNFSTASLRTDLMSLNNSLPSSDANSLSQTNDDSEASLRYNISSNHDIVEFDARSTEGYPSSISVPSEGLTNTYIHTMSAMFHQPGSSYSSSDPELWSARNLISISIPGPILSQSLNANLCSFPLNDKQESPRSSETISSFATPSMRSDNMSSNNSLPSSGANSQSQTTDDSGASSGSNISSNYDRVEVDAWSSSMSSLDHNGGSLSGYSSLNDADANR